MPLIIKRGEDKIITREGVRAPLLLKLRNGDLLLSFHVEGDQHFAKRGAMRSSDNGETWVKDAPRAHREIAWGESASGTVLVFDRDTFEKRQGLYLGSYFRSADGGKSFEGPLESQVFINRVASQDYPVSEDHFPEEGHILKKFYRPLPEYYKPIVRQASYRRGFSFWRYLLEQDGRWLNAMQGTFHGDVCERTILVSSENDGKTWNFVSTIGYEHDKTLDGMCEPVLCRVADGSLLCMMRRGGGKPMAQSRSTDNGRTWSVPEIVSAHGVDPDLCLMSNGVLACTYGRPGQHIMFSEDGCGYSWGNHTEISSGRSSGYMGIAETGPGKLLLAYDRRGDDSQNAEQTHGKCHIGSTTLTVERSSR